MTTKSYLTIAIVAGAFSVSPLALSQSHYADSAKQFMRNLGRSDRLALPESTAHSIGFRNDQGDTVTFEKATGNISLWSNGDANFESNQTNENPRVPDDEAAARTAIAWANRAGFQVEAPNKIEKNRNIGTVISFNVVFSEKAHGYDVFCGNRTVIRVERFSGVVNTMQRHSGWSYDEPRVKVTIARAEQAFRDRISEVYGISVERVNAAMHGYVTSGPDTEGLRSPNAPNLFAVRRARLAYQVKGIVTVDGKASEAVAHVDAETGIVLEGGMTKRAVTALPTGGAKPQGSYLWYGAGLALMIATLWANLRRRRKA